MFTIWLQNFRNEAATVKLNKIFGNCKISANANKKMIIYLCKIEYTVDECPDNVINVIGSSLNEVLQIAIRVPQCSTVGFETNR